MYIYTYTAHAEIRALYQMLGPTEQASEDGPPSSDLGPQSCWAAETPFFGCSGPAILAVSMRCQSQFRY